MASGPPQTPPEQPDRTTVPTSPVPGPDIKPPFEPDVDDPPPETPDSPPAKLVP